MTPGHLHVIDTVINIANNIPNANAFLFISNTGGQDDENPLIASEKEAIARKVIEERIIRIEIKNIGDALGYLKYNGYSNIVLVVGCDRYSSFWRMMKRAEDYNPYLVKLPRKGQVHKDCRYEGVIIESKGADDIIKRGIDEGLRQTSSGEEIVTMSGTKVREKAREVYDEIQKITNGTIDEKEKKLKSNQ